MTIPDKCANELTGHNFGYFGLGYRDGQRPRPGGSARNRYYAQLFVCSGCCHVESVRVHGDDTTFDKLREGAIPATVEQIWWAD